MVKLISEKDELKQAADDIKEGIAAEDRALMDKSLGGKELMESSLGVEGVDMSLFPPPRINLVQYSTKGAETPSGKEIPAGKLWNKATGAMFDKLECALLKVGVTRARFEPWPSEGGPLCVSRNGVTGSEGQVCADCPYSQWHDSPPECRMAFEFLGITDGGEVFVVRFTGTSFKHAKKFVNNVRYSKKPLFAHKVTLTPEKKEGKEGKYFELKILSDGVRTEKQVQKLYKDYCAFGKNFLPQITEGEVMKD